MPEWNQLNSNAPADRNALEAFRQLALRYLDGLLTDEETRALNEQLAASAEFRDIFAALSIEASVLNELLLPSAADREGGHSAFERAFRDTVAIKHPASPLPAKSLFMSANRWPFVAAALLLAAGLGFWVIGGNAGDVGKVVDATPLDATSELFNTRLESGSSSRITLPKVGYAILEGPAEFTMLDPKRARLNSGRIKMRVTEVSGHGFVIETPYGEVTDLGTEFGLDVSNKGKAGLVVFEGEVDLRVAEQRNQSAALSRVERLVGGDGVTFDQGGQLDRIMSIVTGRSATFRSGNDLNEDDSEPLIAGITDNLRASDTKRFYEIVRGGFGEDARAFVDRAYQWNGLDEAGLPEFLVGADYILPYNDDKGRDLEITLSLARPATVYILFDDRGTPPKWLTSAFEHTGFEIGMDEDAGPPSHARPERSLGKGPGNNIDFAFSVWRQDIGTAGSISLGSREGPRGGRSMYGIVVVPLNVTTEGPLNERQARQENSDRLCTPNCNDVQ